MHRRNPYQEKIDFKKLSSKHESLAPFLRTSPSKTGKSVSYDYQDPNALRALTIALLAEDFDLYIKLPDDRLVPTVPQRLNYILWLEDQFSGISTEISGIDIGCGASCIYPLLGACKNGWKFYATEVDLVSAETARWNVSNNKLDEKIDVRLVDKSVVLELPDDSDFDFCMCNPPFYGSEEEARGALNRTAHRPPPHSANSASCVEAITEGGEVAFVSKIVRDSLKWRTRVKLYTSMLGKKSSVKLVKEELAKNNITSVGMTEFHQGNTTRWAVGWTFMDDFQIVGGNSASKKSKKKDKLLIHFFYNVKLNDLAAKLRDVLSDLKIVVEQDSGREAADSCKFSLSAREVTWLHSRRKRRQEKREERERGKRVKEGEQATTEQSFEDTCAGEDGKEEHQEVPESEGPQKNENEAVVKESVTGEGKDERNEENDEDRTANKSKEAGKEDSDEKVVESVVVLRTLGGNVGLEMEFVGGSGGRSAMYQLFLVLRNKMAAQK